MSYTNGTTHYNLPLTTGADKRDWSDTNQSFSDVDAALYGAVQDTAQAALDIDALETRMDTAEQNISTNTGNIAGLDTRVTTVEGAVTSLSGQVTDTRQDLEDMICAYNEASATSTHAYAIGDYFIYNDVLYRATQAIAIGDTIVPDTNCATTNVTTELLALDNSNFVNMDIICMYVEASTTSANNYSIGDYFILNDVLYVVTASITAGDTLTVGTNCDTTTLTNEIKRGTTHTLLYSMPDSTASSANWSGDVITLSDAWDKFDAIAVFAKDASDKNVCHAVTIYPKSTSTDDWNIGFCAVAGTCFIRSRSCSIDSSDKTKLTFGHGYSWNVGDSNFTVNDNVCYPYRIYGVKF